MASKLAQAKSSRISVAIASLAESGLDSEKILLGGLLLEPERFHEVELASTDFGLPSHRDIYTAMAALHEEGCTWDYVLIADALEKRGQLKTIGGRAYLVSLTECLPRQLPLAEHAARIRSGAKRRQLARFAEQLRSACDDAAANPEREFAQFATLYSPNGSAAASGIWTAETAEEFLAGDNKPLPWIEPDILARECLTEMFSPRGLGKTLLALCWAVKFAKNGQKVLYLNRDNPRWVMRERLRSILDDEAIPPTLKFIHREKCPRLTEYEKWASFPYADYDVVIVDSIDSMAEGIGEQDSSKPSRAMAPLLDVCHRDGGPAVLLLGNTTRDAAHSRGSGVIEDRADIVYEVRDGTDFRPTGKNPSWIEELPPGGANEWKARSSRRKNRTKLRLALVNTKPRGGIEPHPQMLELDLSDEPWHLKNVTADVDAEGETARLEDAKQKANRHGDGIRLLSKEIERRRQTNAPDMLKTDAVIWLVEREFKRAQARKIVADDAFVQEQGETEKGRPVRLRLRYLNGLAAEISPSQHPRVYAGSDDLDFCRPHPEPTAEIDPSQGRVNGGDFETPISAGEFHLTGEQKRKFRYDPDQ